MGKTYEIKKGNHYCWHLPTLHSGIIHKKIEFEFTGSCWWLPEISDDFAINKLFGWSMGYHHRDSVRVGWTPNKEPGKIDLFFYLYNKGKRLEHKFTQVEIGISYRLTIDLFDNLVSFTLRECQAPLHGEGKTTTDSHYFKIPDFKRGYMLFPYVGGRLPAKWDMQVWMSE